MFESVIEALDRQRRTAQEIVEACATTLHTVVYSKFYVRWRAGREGRAGLVITATALDIR